MFARIRVSEYPVVLNVSGCSAFSGAIQFAYASLGVYIPADALSGTFDCDVRAGLQLQVSARVGQNVFKSISVAGRVCLVSTQSQSQDVVTVACRMSGPGQGLFQQVVVSVQDADSGLFLSSSPAPKVSFALPQVTQVRCVQRPHHD